MGKGKLRRFQELETFSNVFQNPNVQDPQLFRLNQRETFKGSWAKDYFKNNHEMVLDLACGKGEYTLGLAQAYPHKNVIGVDIKGNRLHRGAKRALEEGRTNVCFLRSKIEVLDAFFDRDEISEIWITFPDPFLRESRSKKRLTSSRFLELYSQFLKPDSKIHLKTDSPELLDFSLETIAETKAVKEVLIRDIYAEENLPEILRIKTYYELMHLREGRTISYLQFRLRS